MGSTSVPTTVVVGTSANPETVLLAVASVVGTDVVVGAVVVGDVTGDVTAPLVVTGPFASFPPPPKQAGRSRTAADMAANSTAIFRT